MLYPQYFFGVSTWFKLYVLCSKKVLSFFLKICERLEKKMSYFFLGDNKTAYVDLDEVYSRCLEV